MSSQSRCWNDRASYYKQLWKSQSGFLHNSHNVIPTSPTVTPEQKPPGRIEKGQETHFLERTRCSVEVLSSVHVAVSAMDVANMVMSLADGGMAC